MRRQGIRGQVPHGLRVLRIICKHRVHGRRNAAHELRMVRELCVLLHVLLICCRVQRRRRQVRVLRHVAMWYCARQWISRRQRSWVCGRRYEYC